MGPCVCNTDAVFGGDAPGIDAGGSTDAGTGDSGATANDAGSGAEDTGSTAADSGSGAVDSGSGSVDAGSGTVDSGSGTADSGSVTADTGNTGKCTPTTMTVSDLAGSGSVGNSDGKGGGARFNNPRGIFLASDGTLLVADRANSRIRRVAMDGTVTTVAGSGLGSTEGGIGKAKFAWPVGLFEHQGSIWVADTSNDKIRLIKSGQVTTVAGTGTQGSTDGAAIGKARFYKPQGVARASDGSLWVADTHNHRIRHIAGGQVKTLAGSSIGGQDGKGSGARFSFPKDIRMLGADALVADRHNHKIRRVKADGTVTTFAGTYKGDVDGPIASARFYEPCGVAIDGKGTVWVADRDNHLIRRVMGGQVVTIAGSSKGHANGVGTASKFSKPWGIAVAADGTLFVGDSGNHRIRKIGCP